MKKPGKVEVFGLILLLVHFEIIFTAVGEICKIKVRSPRRKNRIIERFTCMQGSNERC